MILTCQTYSICGATEIASITAVITITEAGVSKVLIGDTEARGRADTHQEEEIFRVIIEVPTEATPADITRFDIAKRQKTRKTNRAPSRLGWGKSK